MICDHVARDGPWRHHWATCSPKVSLKNDEREL